MSTLEIVLVRSADPEGALAVQPLGLRERVAVGGATNVGVNAPVVVSHGHHLDYATLPLGGGNVGSLKVDRGAHREMWEPGASASDE